jgi:hypothetical protein
MKAAVHAVVDAEVADGKSDVRYFEIINTSGYGCGWHPDRATHASWAANLSNTIKTMMGW